MTTKTLVALLLLTAILGAAASTPSAVQGSVLDDTDKPVAGARVLIAAALPATAPHFAAPPVITGPLSTTATADSPGAFTIPTLPAGQYIACAEATTPGLLDPCHWATSAPTFTVTAGKTATGVNITMARGAVIPIHIDDPQSLLKPVAGPIDFDLQIHAVTAKGHHYNANIESSTATTRDHVITVPVSGTGTSWQNVGTLTIEPPPTLGSQPTVTLTDNTQGSGDYFAGDSFTLTVTGPPDQPVGVSINGFAYGTQGYTNSSGVYSINGSWSSANVGSYLENWFVESVAGPNLLFSILPVNDISGPPSIPNSYNGVLPQQFCNDITGNWIVSGTGGVGAEWDLVQTGTGVQGTSYVSTPSCGVVGSPITGYLSGNTFSLNFTSNSSCTAPASASVSLTSNSCSVGSGQVTPGVGGITLQPKRSTNNPVPTPNPPTAHYNITYAAYIPVDNILGPRPCPYFTPGQQLPVPWLPLYKGDANRGTYRAAQSVVVIPDAARDYNFYYNTGATRNFGFGSPANGSNANLDSYPLTSDIYFGPYGGADEDTVDLDCYKWNNAGHAPTTGMQVDSVSYPSPTQAQAHLYGSATNPLEPSPPITWDMNVVVDDSNPASPTAYVNYNHTCYPAHIVKVNGTVVYSYQPAYNNPFYLGNCLLQSPLFGKVVGQSSAVIVPLQ